MSDIAPLGRGRHAQPPRPQHPRIKGLNGHAVPSPAAPHGTTSRNHSQPTASTSPTPPA